MVWVGVVVGLVGAVMLFAALWDDIVDKFNLF